MSENLLETFINESESMKEEIQILYDYTMTNKYKNILELGMGKNSTPAFCYAVSKLSGSSFTGVDIDPKVHQEIVDDLAKHDLIKPNISLINGESVQYLLETPKRFDCIFIDTDHTYKQTVTEIFNAGMKLTPGGHIFLHDTGQPAVENAVRLFLVYIKGYFCIEFNTIAGLCLLMPKTLRGQ